MRSFSTFFLLFSIVLVNFLVDARKSPGDYWKTVMNNEPMPDVIKDLLFQDTTEESGEKKHTVTSNTDHFIRSFDIRPNVILYHSNVDSKRVKPFDDEFNLPQEKNQHIKLKKKAPDHDNAHNY